MVHASHLFWTYLFQFLIGLCSSTLAACEHRSSTTNFQVPNEATQEEDSEQIWIAITNGSLSRMDVFWLNPDNFQLLQMTDIPLIHGASAPYHAFLGHQFFILERPDPGRGDWECRNELHTCRTTIIQVERSEKNQVFLINRDFLPERIQALNDPHDEPIPSLINMINKSGSSLQIFWFPPHTMKAALLADGTNGEVITLNSFAHQFFEVRQTGSCEFNDYQPCKSVGFLNPHDAGPLVTITRQFQVMYQQDDIGFQTEFDNMTVGHASNGVTESVSRLVHKCQHSTAPNECVEENVRLRILQAVDALAFEKILREKVGAQLEAYSCKDDAQKTSPPIGLEEWHHEGHAALTVFVMLDRPTAKIHVIHNFVTQEECTAMESAAANHLSPSIGFDGKGRRFFNPVRQSLESQIVVPWEEESLGNPITKVSRRAFDYVNQALDMQIKEHGQEPIMSIQYRGRGLNETSPDQYKPHCDGECNGLHHKRGDQIASMIMYCKLPKRGGHTNFRNSNVHIKPEKHMAVFISYMDPKTNLTDSKLTQHSGCPVWEGEKIVFTQWVRYGVDEGYPWDAVPKIMTAYIPNLT